MKRINNFYSIIFALVLSVFFFTGCPNVHSNKTTDNKKIMVKTTIKLPAAMPAMKNSKQTSRSASYSWRNLKMEMLAQEQEGDNSFTYPIENTEYTSVTECTIPFPNSGLWTVSFKCYSGEELILASQSKTVDIYDEGTVLEPFILAPLSQNASQPGSIKLPVISNVYSSVTQLNWKLVNESDSTIVYTGSVTFTESQEYLQKDSVTPGNYIAYFSFVKGSFQYGPVVEYITVLGNMCTDTWYGCDSFIQYYDGQEEYMLFMPSDENLLNYFPEYSFATAPAATDSIAILWNQDKTGSDISYNPYSKTGYSLYFTDSITENTYIGDGEGIPIANGIDVYDFTIDAKTNDVYFAGMENDGVSITKYARDQGYASYKGNTFSNETDPLISMAADNGAAYVLSYDMAENKFVLYKGVCGEDGLVFSYYSDIVNSMNASDIRTNVKMSVCQNYLYIVSQTNQSSCICYVFQLGDTPKVVVTRTELNFAYTCGFNVNDIRAVETDTLQDLYLLLGYLSTPFEGTVSGQYVNRAGGAYGGVLRVHLKQEGNDFLLNNEIKSNSYPLIRGFSAPEHISDDAHRYSTTEEDDNKYFYHPLKFTGNSSGQLIIADDGAYYYSDKYENNITPKNRIVSINIDDLVDETDLSQFTSVTPIYVSFDYYHIYSSSMILNDPGEFENYKESLYSGTSSVPGGNILYEVPGNQPFIRLGNDSLDVTLSAEHYNGGSWSWIETNVLPVKKGDKMYVNPTSSVSNLTFDITLYCNGKPLENDPQDPYYSVDSQEGTLALLKPLPVMGYEYQLAIDLIQTIPASDGGEPTVIHNDFLKTVVPNTEFDIHRSTWKDIATKDDVNACLDNFLISDRAVIIASVNNSNSNPAHIMPIPFMEAVRDYFIAHPCADLTLNYSRMAGFDDVEAGLFGMNCSKIIMPVKSATSTAVPSTIKKGAFEYTDENGKTHYFQGHLVLHKSIQTIENGAFSVPPGSIEIDNTGYTATSTNTSTISDFYVVDVVPDGYGKYMLIQSLYQYTRIYTCTKRDEPFTLDFTPDNYQYYVQIDDNAFKGLPVTGDDNTSVKLGNVRFVGEGAFAETNAKAIDAPNLKLIGMRAFPNFEGETYLSLTTEDGKGWYQAKMTDATKWDEQWAEALTKASPRYETDSLNDYVKGEDTENGFSVSQISTSGGVEYNILSAINENDTDKKYFVFKKDTEY